MRNDSTVADVALYFPYMDVPDSPALTRVLLYWDQLGSIIPLDIYNWIDRVNSPDWTERTLELVHAGLVLPVNPRQHWEELRGLEDEFLQVLDTQRIEAPMVAPTQIRWDKAVIGLWSELGHRGLVRGDYPWMEVDGRVGALYMAFLAGRLGRCLDMEPITDRREYFRESTPDGRAHETADLFDRMRGAILRDVLPAPLEPVAPRELAKFKEKYWDLLRSFRRRVESELVDCARERDPELRRRMLERARNDISEGVDEIASRLRARRWHPGVGLLCVAIAGAPAVTETVITGNPFPATGAAAAPLAEVVRSALSGGRQSSADTPLAYAALAREAFA